VRVACLRSGVVLSARGGALRAQLLPFKLGLGGRLGSGRQWLSWITIDDEVAGIRRVLDDDRLAGPINVTSPNPVTNAEFTKTLGRVLRRPTALPIPTIALRLRFGSEMTAEMLLAGQRVMPTVLDGNGFAFAHPRLEEGLRHVLSMPAQGRG
jgi:uncharacterized protein (TIGR01777 family)